MRVEIEKGIENYAEQQESFDKYRKSSQCQLEALERKNNELILLTESFGLFCKDACLALGLEYVEDNSLKDHAHSVLETIKTLSKQKSEADASTSRLMEELKSSIEQKQHALDHLQARQRDFEETMRKAELKNCETVAELEKKNRELQAANESIMTEAKSLRNTKTSLEDYENFYAEIKSKLTNVGEANSPQQVLEVDCPGVYFIYH